MVKIYNKHTQSQQELIKKLADIPALLAQIFQIVESKSRAWRYFRVFNVILSYINQKVIYPTREQLAKAAGCSVETVSEAVKFLERQGWLREVKHRYNSSNIYYISLIFYSPALRKYLAPIFPACAMFLKWDYAVRISASGAVCQRTGILLYIDEYNSGKKDKKKRLSRVFTPRLLTRDRQPQVKKQPDGENLWQDLSFLDYRNEVSNPLQPLTGGSQLSEAKRRWYEDDYCEDGRYGTLNG